MLLDGAGTYVPAPDHLFYKIDFLQTTVVDEVVFRDTNADGNSIYTVTASAFDSTTFPAGYSWNAPISSIDIGSGLAVAYQYKLFTIEDLFYCR